MVITPSKEIATVVAASIVPAHKQASAVATMFMGLTIANIGGVPLATWVPEEGTVVQACNETST
jgi:predicted MFS family arabinose efflux permease